MADRRRVNAPAGGTAPPIFASTLPGAQTREQLQSHKPRRTRGVDEPRKIFLQTGLTPSASGSAYLELQQPPAAAPSDAPPSLIPAPSTLKLSCTVHGPRPLPRSAPFSPALVLAAHVSFAPFAQRNARAYGPGASAAAAPGAAAGGPAPAPLRRGLDARERDLGAHLEAALRGAVLGARWPKSGCDVAVEVLEAEEGGWWADAALPPPPGASSAAAAAGSAGLAAAWGSLSVLAGCITVASAALADAGIDCLGLVAGGVAALVPPEPPSTSSSSSAATATTTPATAAAPRGAKGGVAATRLGGRPAAPVAILDPCPAEHAAVLAAAVVGYIPERDELTALWFRGSTEGAEGGEEEVELVERAALAATAVHGVLVEAVREGAEAKFGVMRGGE
ncbi:3' exoribonuclease family, domain 1-domain-containing protein, partial [Lineolata rhizophorae]